MRHALNTPRPQSLVKLRIEPNVGGAHGFLSEVDDRLYGPGGTLLEGTAMDAFV